MIVHVYDIYPDLHVYTNSFLLCVYSSLYFLLYFYDVHKTINFDDTVLFTSSGAVIKTDRLPEWIEPIDNITRSRLFALYIPHIKQHFNRFLFNVC